MGFEAWVKGYLACLCTMNYSQGTVRSNRYILGWLVAWCEKRGLRDPVAVQRCHLEQFQHWLYCYRKKDGRPLALETQQTRLIVIRRFFQWLTRRGVLECDPAAHLELPRGQHRLPTGILSAHEIARMLCQPDLGTALGLRDRAMLEVFYATGIRRMELCNLKVYDLNMSGEVVRIRQGEGRNGK